MDVQIKGKDLVITGLKDFDLTHIFECGQCFRWNMVSDGTYVGVAKERALKITQNGDTAILYDTRIDDFENIWYEYFDLGRDYGAIKKELFDGDIMDKAIKYGGGIRILRQDLWETVISFIISASNNIPRIKGIIERLCAMYGKEIEYMGEIYYSFPSVSALSTLTREDLAPIRAGYRDKYILDAAYKFGSGELSQETIYAKNSEDAKKALMSINGIGNKVANCIMLFGLGHAHSFPVDVWIKRVMEYYFFDKEQSIDEISRFAKEKFGSLGGYAQQYLFFYARENKEIFG